MKIERIKQNFSKPCKVTTISIHIEGENLIQRLIYALLCCSFSYTHLSWFIREYRDWKENKIIANRWQSFLYWFDHLVLAPIYCLISALTNKKLIGNQWEVI